ncbi:hypothetical protein [Methanoplanus endosymbiosus]|uniref:Uncharacterized protein n=1 Tax=Methanoplanus endosymbiosus TaxID=33865 RepID=A0A9E7TL57_9EURY|nr:hypothetical protein [Methanoplanus endosymbiosus]UUX91966.1 hypothetical protein L6E24_11450 [Methanoplanus endosymbiosus]
MNSRPITILIMAGIILIALTLPASADRAIPTDTKVFFEKDGQPYNGTVSFTVTCYGYIVDDTDPNYKNYWGDNYQRREPGTYEQTEVFSYSATVDHYGDSIYEPFYLNYRVTDHCTLCGETEGHKFVIENAGESPIPDCKMKEFMTYRDRDTDTCRIQTKHSDACFEEEAKLKREGEILRNSYIEVFDEDKTYSGYTKTFVNDNGTTMILTEEYFACDENISKIDLKCRELYETVACEDYCNPDGQPIDRDCNLYYTIPTDDNGNIIETDKGQDCGIAETITEKGAATQNVRNETAKNRTLSQNSRTDTDDSLFTAIMRFFGLIK